MPNFGPKQRETKSYLESSDRAVTTAISNAANFAKSGRTARTSLASASSNTHPIRPCDAPAAATACIHAGPAGFSSRQTAAGLPVKGPDANASTWKRGARMDSGLLDDDQHVAGAHRVTGRDADLLHGAAPLGVDVVLHLHRLEHEQRLAGLDGVALRDEHLHDRALHRRAHGAVAAGAAAGRHPRLIDLAAPPPAAPGSVAGGRLPHPHP